MGNRSSLHSENSILPSDSYSAFVPIIHRNRIFDDYLLTGKQLGFGVCGKVQLAVCKRTKKFYAVKPFNKLSPTKQKIEFLKSEAKIYMQLDHPNIAKLYSIYEDEQNVWMVIEYCSGGELYEKLQKREVYNEECAADLVFQMLEAINYLHSNNIVHRDIKLENFLFEDSNENSRIKLIDFGFSKTLSNKLQKAHSICGSISYVSPEILLGSYSYACDLWSLGIIVFMLLVGYPPFFGCNESAIIAKIKRGEYSLAGRAWNEITEAAKNFVSGLLEIDESKRLTAKEALQHPWIVNRKSTMKYNTNNINIEVLKTLQSFSEATTLKKAFLSLIAHCLTSSEIHELTDLFLEFDKNQDGSIQINDFAAVMHQHFNISHEEVLRLFSSFHTTSHIVYGGGICESENVSASNKYSTVVGGSDAFGETSSVEEEGISNSKLHPHKDGGNDVTVEQAINYRDFVAALLEMRIRQNENLIREAFFHFDFDRTNFITIESFREILGDCFMGEEIEDLIRIADKNHDGKIEYEEFLDIVLNDVNTKQAEKYEQQNIIKDEKAPSVSNESESLVYKLANFVDNLERKNEVPTDLKKNEIMKKFSSFRGSSFDTLLDITNVVNTSQGESLSSLKTDFDCSNSSSGLSTSPLCSHSIAKSQENKLENVSVVNHDHDVKVECAFDFSKDKAIANSLSKISNKDALNVNTNSINSLYCAIHKFSVSSL